MAAVVAVAFLFRHDHGLFLGCASMVCVAAASRADGWRAAARRSAVLVIATTVFLLPWVAFIALNGGLLSYFSGGLEYSRAEADATALERWPQLNLGSPVQTIASAEAWLFWLFWSVPAVCGVCACLRLARGRERWAHESAVVLGLVTAAVLVDATFLRETLWVRLPDAIAPAALLGAWALGLCWSGAWHARALQAAVRLATVVAMVVTLVAITRVAGLSGQIVDADLDRGVSGIRARVDETFQLLATSHRQNLAPPSRVSTGLMPFFAYAARCTAPSDRLVVTGEFPEILVLAGRGFAGDGVVFGSWYASSAHQDRTLRRLKATPALFVLHVGDYDGFRQRFGLIDMHINGAYAPMAQLPVDGADAVRILVYKSHRPAHIDQATGWPCFR
jgi:hypothetical protein